MSEDYPCQRLHMLVQLVNDLRGEIIEAQAHLEDNFRRNIEPDRTVAAWLEEAVEALPIITRALVRAYNAGLRGREVTA